MKFTYLTGLFMSVMAMMACSERKVIDGSSVDRYWQSVAEINMSLSPEERADFQFALTRLRKMGYAEDELVEMSKAPVGEDFLKKVGGKTAQEIIQISEPHKPTKAR